MRQIYLYGFILVLSLIFISSVQAIPIVIFKNATTGSGGGTTYNNNTYVTQFVNQTANVTRGFGFNLTGQNITNTGGILDINTTQIQARISSSCTSSQAIRVINVDGTVACVNIPGLSNIFDQNLNTTNNIHFANLTVDGNVTATIFYGDGSQLSNQLTSSIGNATYLLITDQRYNDTLIVQAVNITYFNFNQNLTSYICPSGMVQNGVNVNGTIKCVVDANSGSTISNASLNAIYLNLSGTNANQNINIGVYNLSGNNFIGDGSQLTGITYNHNQTPLAGSNISVTGRTVSINSTQLLQWLNTVYQAVGNYLNGNPFDQNLNQSSNVKFGNATIAGNVTATIYYGDGSQLSNLPSFNSTYAAQRNETNRIQNLTSYDCGTGFVVQGVYDNGTVACVADANSGSTISNASLNAIYRLKNETINQNNVSDFFNNVVTSAIVNSTYQPIGKTDNASLYAFQQNNSAYDCGVGFVVNAIYDNGTISCVADANSGGTISNSTLNNTYLNLSGTNANQNINIGIFNLTATSFVGDGSQITGILYNHNQTPLAGSNISVSGRTVSINDTSLLQWLNTVYQAVGNYITSAVSPYLFITGGNTVNFNETQLNKTIDARATGNASWNQSFANTLYMAMNTNIFNQDLNKTSSVQFGNLTVNGQNVTLAVNTTVVSNYAIIWNGTTSYQFWNGTCIITIAPTSRFEQC